MPITKSAKKSVRQSLKRKSRNIGKKRKLKDLLKKVKSLTSEKKIKEVKLLVPQIYKLLDKAAKKGLIKKNTADRKKSRITKSINKNS
ncbi:30S ribosomal protein S20 [Candidatus Parcubacteria bacterium]|nr:30S ribosomal protein S20 [Candidatus Parcubacteria bacterium]